MKKSDGVKYAIKEVKLNYSVHHDLASSVLTLSFVAFYFDCEIYFFVILHVLFADGQTDILLLLPLLTYE